MPNHLFENIKNKIIERHQGDDKQLEVILSKSTRLLVEAPAGYGKTNTMVSKIAYLLATEQIPNPKKLLVLTFSVNAAFKIKKDVAHQIPHILEAIGSNIRAADKLFVSNFHGFARSVLKKHGRVLQANLNSIDTLQPLDDSDIKTTNTTVTGLSLENATFLSTFSDEVKKGNEKYLESNQAKYCSIIIEYFLPQGYITYNAILTLTRLLFERHPNTLAFYTKYYSTILIDEFQDTNILSFRIIKSLITKETTAIFFGDSLQRIYGFIGALENLLSIAEKEFGLAKVELSKNYRFASNPDMLRLDNNIRKNAENPSNPTINENATIEVKISNTQKEEALYVVTLANNIVRDFSTAKVAILAKQRGPNIESILQCLNENQTTFFNGLFSDEDPHYKSFHKICKIEFIELIRSKSGISIKIANEHITRVSKHYSESEDSLSAALSILLEIFWHKLQTEYSFLSNEDKVNFVLDTFENNSLKQYIEFIRSNIIVSTIHAAKGLEWDYVILPDMEQDSFPNWFGMCRSCDFRTDCNVKVDKKNESKFLEELSVFYVAVTRAKKHVYFTSSKQDARGNKKNLSCYLKLPGLIFPYW